MTRQKRSTHRLVCRSPGRPAASGRWRFTATTAKLASSRGTGPRKNADTETVDVEKCGLCGGDSFKKDVFRDTGIRLIAQVTARNVKRD